jgi:hypothetical protein
MAVRRSVLGYVSTALLALVAFAIAGWASGEPVRSGGYGSFAVLAVLTFIGTTFLSARSVRGWRLIFLLSIALVTGFVVFILLWLGNAAVECQSHNNCLFN